VFFQVSASGSPVPFILDGACSAFVVCGSFQCVGVSVVGVDFMSLFALGVGLSVSVVAQILCVGLHLVRCVVGRVVVFMALWGG